MRPYQIQAVEAADTSLASGQKNISIHLASGTGRTTVLIGLLYRLISQNRFKKILVATDRPILERQLLEALRTTRLEGSATVADLAWIKRVDGQIDLFDPDESPTPIIYLATLRSSSEELPDFDLAILTEPACVDLLGPRRDSASDVPFLLFSTTPIRYLPDSELAFSYSLESAIEEGNLVRFGSGAGANLSTSPSEDAYQVEGSPRPTVIVFHSIADSHSSKKISRLLSDAGFTVSTFEVGNESRLGSEELPSAKFFVPILSQSSSELNATFSDALLWFRKRGVDVVPAIVEPCLIPRPLLELAVVDLTGRIDRIATTLALLSRIDFRELRVDSFENLCLELLRRNGFAQGISATSADTGYDYQGRYSDVLGLSPAVDYVILLKFSRSGHQTVRNISRLVSIVESDLSRRAGLLVTNAQLNSAAMEYLDKLRMQDLAVHVFDGARVKALLSRNPDLVEEYFPRPASRDGDS